MYKPIKHKNFASLSIIHLRWNNRQ